MKGNTTNAYRCTNCGRMTYPKRVACLGCRGRTFEEVPFGQKCTLATFSVISQLPWGINDRFLTIGVCQFENGAKAMGRITSPDVKTGQPMKARWEKFREMAGEPVWGWVFDPA